MADKPAETAAPEPEPAPPKSKKMLVMILGVVLVLVLGAGGAYVYVMKQRAAAAAGLGYETPAVTREAAAPPVYFPFENMVVNLADPGGEKVVQVGITLELVDSHATDLVKRYLPTIRSAVLILVSQRTSEELLQRQGKEKLATDIRREALRPLGFVIDPPAGVGATKNEDGAKDQVVKNSPEQEELPIRRVLFSSFIVQ